MIDPVHITDEQFADLIAGAMDEMPEHYAQEMNNVAITWDDQPSPEQRHKLQLRCNESLFGLYEGIPLPHRGAGYNLVLPDKITLFKLPLLQASHDQASLKANIKHTLWHELAHHFGLEHHRIHELERRHASQHGDHTA